MTTEVVPRGPPGGGPVMVQMGANTWSDTMVVMMVT